MTGLKMTTMTIEEMDAARDSNESRSDLVFLRKNKLEGIELEDDDDSPDATHLIIEAISKRRAGRPTGNSNKEQVAIRFDKEVLAAFRATGKGWHTRMNDVLKAWLKDHQPESTPNP